MNENTVFSKPTLNWQVARARNAVDTSRYPKMPPRLLHVLVEVSRLSKKGRPVCLSKINKIYDGGVWGSDDFGYTIKVGVYWSKYAQSTINVAISELCRLGYLEKVGHDRVQLTGRTNPRNK